MVSQVTFSKSHKPQAQNHQSFPTCFTYTEQVWYGISCSHQSSWRAQTSGALVQASHRPPS